MIFCKWFLVYMHTTRQASLLYWALDKDMQKMKWCHCAVNRVFAVSVFAYWSVVLLNISGEIDNYFSYSTMLYNYLFINQSVEQRISPVLRKLNWEKYTVATYFWWNEDLFMSLNSFFTFDVCFGIVASNRLHATCFKDSWWSFMLLLPAIQMLNSLYSVPQCLHWILSTLGSTVYARIYCKSPC